jgi:hypothetical protein
VAVGQDDGATGDLGDQARAGIVFRQLAVAGPERRLL